MKYVLHPDRSNAVFGNLSSEDRVECEVFTRQAYDFLDGCSTVASGWLRRDQVVDRAGLFRQRPSFAEFDDSFLPAFFRKVGGPKFKARRLAASKNFSAVTHSTLGHLLFPLLPSIRHVGQIETFCVSSRSLLYCFFERLWTAVVLGHFHLRAEAKHSWQKGKYARKQYSLEDVALWH